MSASQQLVVGVDGSPSSIQALDQAIATARNALTGPGEAEVEIATYIGEGPAAQILLDRARHARLLVVGTRGHGGLSKALLGSVSQHLVHHAHCPVVVIPDGAA